RISDLKFEIHWRLRICSSSARNSSLSRRRSSTRRDLSVRYRVPRISVFCNESAHARNCLEMLSALVFKSEISDLKLTKSGNRSNRQNIDRVSPAEPREM